IFTRLPRSVRTRRFWKASEWKHWLLFYCIPCLSGLIPDRYLAHYSNIVNATYILLKQEISEVDLTQAEAMLTNFNHQTQTLYGYACMTFNVHQILHFAKSVKKLGPTLSHSGFPFEGNMGKLPNMVTAAKGAPKQIVNRY